LLGEWHMVGYGQHWGIAIGYGDIVGTMSIDAFFWTCNQCNQVALFSIGKGQGHRRQVGSMACCQVVEQVWLLMAYEKCPEQ